MAMGCAITGTATAGINSWSMREGPFGGVSWLQFSSSNIVYAGTSYGIYRSDDGGATWSLRAEDFVPSGLTAMAVDPSNPNRILAAASLLGDQRSEDGGLTFSGRTELPPIVTPSTFKFDIREIIVSRDGRHICYNQSAVPLFSCSHDDAGTGGHSVPPGGGLGRIMFDPVNPMTMYWAGGFSSQLGKSIDGAASWTTLTRPPTAEIYTGEILPGTPTTLFVSTKEGIYVTTDDGENWTLSLPLPLQSRAVLVADPNRAGEVLAVTPDRAVYVYSAGSWAQLRAASNLDRIFLVAIAPGNSQRLLALTTRGIDASNDRGVTWAASDNGISATSPIVLSVAAAGRVFAAGNTHIFYQASAQDAWNSIHLPVGVNSLLMAMAVHPTDPNTLLVAGNGGNYFRTTDGGATWTPGPTQVPALQPQAIAFDPVDPSVVYMSGFDLVNVGSWGEVGHIFRSTDAGTSFAEVLRTPISLSAAQIVVDPLEHSRVYVLGPYEQGSPKAPNLFRTLNGGATWIALGGAPVGGRSEVAVDPTKPGRIYARAAAGLLQISLDSGDTWSDVPATSDISKFVVDPAVGTIYAIRQVRTPNGNLSSTPIVRSVDQGQTWESLPIPIKQPSNWDPGTLLLSPTQPGVLLVGASSRGVTSFQFAPDLQVTITGHSGSRVVNEAAGFDVNVTNSGPYAANAAKLAVTLPAAMQSVSATSNAGTCSIVARSLQCQTVFLKTNTQMTVHVAYMSSTLGDLPVHATASAYETDSVTANNSAEASASIVNKKKGGGGGAELLLLAVLGTAAASRRLLQSMRPN